MMRGEITIKWHGSLGELLDTAGDKRQQQMWNLLRGPQGREGLEPADLAFLCSTDLVRVSEAQARTYLDALTTRSRARQKLDGRYFVPAGKRLAPLAPRLMQVRFLVDPNDWSVSKLKMVAEGAIR